MTENDFPRLDPNASMQETIAYLRLIKQAVHNTVLDDLFSRELLDWCFTHIVNNWSCDVMRYHQKLQANLENRLDNCEHQLKEIRHAISTIRKNLCELE